MAGNEPEVMQPCPLTGICGYFTQEEVAVIKAVNVLSGFVCRGRFVAAHTALNRLAGMLLFLLPLTLPFVPLAHTAPPVCAVAALAAVHEGHVIRTGQTGGTRG